MSAERRVFSRLMAGNRRWLLGAIVLAILAALASVGLVAVSGWFLTATALAGLSAAIRLEVFLPAALIRAFAILRTVGRYLERLLTHELIFRGISRLRAGLFRSLSNRPLPELDALADERALTRLVADAERLEAHHATMRIPLLAALATSVALAATLALLLDPAAGLTVLAVALALAWLVVGGSRRAGIARAADSLRRDRGARYLGGLLDAHRELHHLDPNRGLRDRILNAFERHGLRETGRAASAGRMEGLMALLVIVGVAVLLAQAATVPPETRETGLAGAPRIALGVLALLALGAVWGGLHEAWQQRVVTALAARRLDRDLAASPGPRSVGTVGAAAKNTPPELRLEAIRVRRGLADQALLEDIHLELAPGAWLAISGRSGCGKSTLAELLTARLIPDSGRVLMDGRELSELPEAVLFRRIGLLQQDNVLFADTLWRNLVVGAPDSEPDNVIRALEDLGLEYLVPHLDTWIGSGGRQLSGGEARRICLLRTLLAGPELVILDEPLRGLDAVNRDRVLNCLREQLDGRSLLWLDHQAPDLPLTAHWQLQDGRLERA